MSTVRTTVAQALVDFLAVQHVERDGQVTPFFAGCLGIFGHGNVAGVGEALRQRQPDFRYVLARNEQAMVHTAAAHARMRDRLQTWACTTSIGPGATNLVTGAAAATINRLPVLLLPGDTFATRQPRPVLQQLEAPGEPGLTVNDALRPVCRFFDRVHRPEQLASALLDAMRTLTDPADTGAAAVCLPQDVQAEAVDVPAALLEPRTWHVPRAVPEPGQLDTLAGWVQAAERPLIVAGGGVIYAGAAEALAALAGQTGIPVVETQAGKGSLAHDHPAALGAVGVTGTPGANEVAARADLVIGIGTRWSDFTTGSQALLANPDLRVACVNVTGADAHKLGGLPVIGDARLALEGLAERLAGHTVSGEYTAAVADHAGSWRDAVDAAYRPDRPGPAPSQPEVIGAVNEAAGATGVVVCAAGSMPGELHRLWRSRDPKQYHVEYGYSTMGYEIPGGIGVKLAAPDREVFVLVGDGSYLMMPGELVTAVAERLHLVVVLVDNGGFASIGGLSTSLGSQGFGTSYQYRSDGGILDGGPLPVDLAANAESLGATVWRPETSADLRVALDAATRVDGVAVVAVRTDPTVAAPGDGAWWDVPVSEVSTDPAVSRIRQGYDEHRRRQRHYLDLEQP